MIYIINNSTKPDYNLALEEYCFKHLLHQDKVFILWINEPTIVVGKHQNTLEEINQEYVRNHDIHVVRRPSGGGAVYHDLNNLNFTIISNEDKGVDFDFKTFSEPVIETLGELGVKADFTGRNDLVINDKKICGNAQAYMTGRIMHHGCLLFDVDLTVLGQALDNSKEKVVSNSVKSVRSRVTNILEYLPEKISVKEFSEKILTNMLSRFPQMQEYQFTEKELEEIEQIRKKKYGNWEWVYGKSPSFNTQREKRFTAGKIQVFIDVKRATIKKIKFYGTFFGNNSDLSMIEAALEGVKYKAVAIREKLLTMELNTYFAGFTVDEVVESIIEL